MDRLKVYRQVKSKWIDKKYVDRQEIVAQIESIWIDTKQTDIKLILRIRSSIVQSEEWGNLIDKKQMH